MRIEQLKYFVEIAKCRSIKKASDNLFLTQQSLSQTMKNLEKEVGFLLLNRLPSGVDLTEEGRLFADFAQKVLDEQAIFWQQIENLPQHMDQTPSGTLKFHIFGLFDVCILPDILHKFCLHYPRVTIQTTTMDQHAIEESFANTTDDVIGMITLPSAEVERYNAYLHEKQLAFVPFGEGEYHLCCNRNHPLKTRCTEIPLKAAMQYPLIQYSIGDDTRYWENDTLHRLLGQYGHGDKAYCLTVRSLHTWIANLLYSDKIGFLHEFILHDMKNRYDTFRELVVLPTKEPLSATLGCIIQQDHSPLVQSFMTFLPKIS